MAPSLNSFPIVKNSEKYTILRNIWIVRMDENTFEKELMC